MSKGNRAAQRQRYKERYPDKIKAQKARARERERLGLAGDPIHANAAHTARAARLRRLRKGQEFINWLKDVPCKDCGNRFPPECMDFDHLHSKRRKLANMWHFGFETIMKEAAKCEVVCANCHRTRTLLRRNSSP